MTAETIDAVLLEAGPCARWIEVPSEGGGASTAALRALVGGPLTHVPAGEGIDLWANGRAYLDGDGASSVNGYATKLAEEANDGWSVLYGPCILTASDASGKVVSLPREVGDRLIERHPQSRRASP